MPKMNFWNILHEKQLALSCICNSTCLLTIKWIFLRCYMFCKFARYKIMLLES